MKMPRFQFSLRTLLLAFIPVGLAIAALVNANYLWANAVLTVTLALLGTSLVGWIWTLKKARAFWSGFAVFGWGYMLLAFGPWFSEHVSANLISHQVLETSASLFGHQAAIGQNVSTFWENKDWSRQAGFVTDQKYRASIGRTMHYWDYLFVGHCLFTLISGLAGGFIGCWFYARRDIHAKEQSLDDRCN
jgi:hypothetical protein